MDIKPTGQGAQLPPATNTDERVEKTSFRQVETSQAAGRTSEIDQPLAALKTQFRKADLQDPAKVETMLTHCTGELLESAIGRMNSPISEADTAYLGDWLRNDPSIRGKLLSYLEQVLT